MANITGPVSQPYVKEIAQQTKQAGQVQKAQVQAPVTAPKKELELGQGDALQKTQGMDTRKENSIAMLTNQQVEAQIQTQLETQVNCVQNLPDEVLKQLVNTSKPDDIIGDESGEAEKAHTGKETELKKEIKDVKDNKSSAITKIESLAEKYKTAELSEKPKDEIDEVQSEIEAFQNQIDEVQAQMDKCQGQGDDLQSQIDELQTQRYELQAKFDSLKTPAFKDAEDYLSGKELDESKNKLFLEAVAKEKTNLKLSIRDLDPKIKNLKEKINEFEKSIKVYTAVGNPTKLSESEQKLEKTTTTLTKNQTSFQKNITKLSEIVKLEKTIGQKSIEKETAKVLGKEIDQVKDPSTEKNNLKAGIKSLESNAKQLKKQIASLEKCAEGDPKLKELEPLKLELAKNQENLQDDITKFGKILKLEKTAKETDKKLSSFAKKILKAEMELMGPEAKDIKGKIDNLDKEMTILQIEARFGEQGMAKYKELTDNLAKLNMTVNQVSEMRTDNPLYKENKKLIDSCKDLINYCPVSKDKTTLGELKKLNDDLVFNKVATHNLKYDASVKPENIAAKDVDTFTQLGPDHLELEAHLKNEEHGITKELGELKTEIKFLESRKTEIEAKFGKSGMNKYAELNKTLGELNEIARNDLPKNEKLAKKLKELVDYCPVRKDGISLGELKDIELKIATYKDNVKQKETELKTIQDKLEVITKLTDLGKVKKQEIAQKLFDSVIPKDSIKDLESVNIDARDQLTKNLGQMKNQLTDYKNKLESGINEIKDSPACKANFFKDALTKNPLMLKAEANLKSVGETLAKLSDIDKFSDDLTSTDMEFLRECGIKDVSVIECMVLQPIAEAKISNKQAPDDFMKTCIYNSLPALSKNLEKMGLKESLANLSTDQDLPKSLGFETDLNALASSMKDGKKEIEPSGKEESLVDIKKIVPEIIKTKKEEIAQNLVDSVIPKEAIAQGIDSVKGHAKIKLETTVEHLKNYQTKLKEGIQEIENLDCCKSSIIKDTVTNYSIMKQSKEKLSSVEKILAKFPADLTSTDIGILRKCGINDVDVIECMLLQNITKAKTDINTCIYDNLSGLAENLETSGFKDSIAKSSTDPHLPEVLELKSDLESLASLMKDGKREIEQSGKDYTFENLTQIKTKIIPSKIKKINEEISKNLVDSVIPQNLMAQGIGAVKNHAEAKIKTTVGHLSNYYNELEKGIQGIENSFFKDELSKNPLMAQAKENLASVKTILNNIDKFPNALTATDMGILKKCGIKNVDVIECMLLQNITKAKTDINTCIYDNLSGLAESLETSGFKERLYDLSTDKYLPEVLKLKTDLTSLPSLMQKLKTEPSGKDESLADIKQLLPEIIKAKKQEISQSIANSLISAIPKEVMAQGLDSVKNHAETKLKASVEQMHNQLTTYKADLTAAIGKTQSEIENSFFKDELNKSPLISQAKENVASVEKILAKLPDDLTSSDMKLLKECGIKDIDVIECMLLKTIIDSKPSGKSGEEFINNCIHDNLSGLSVNLDKTGFKDSLSELSKAPGLSKALEFKTDIDALPSLMQKLKTEPAGKPETLENLKNLIPSTIDAKKQEIAERFLTSLQKVNVLPEAEKDLNAKSFGEVKAVAKAKFNEKMKIVTDSLQKYSGEIVDNLNKVAKSLFISNKKWESALTNAITKNNAIGNLLQNIYKVPNVLNPDDLNLLRECGIKDIDLVDMMTMKNISESAEPSGKATKDKVISCIKANLDNLSGVIGASGINDTLSNLKGQDKSDAKSKALGFGANIDKLSDIMIKGSSSLNEYSALTNAVTSMAKMKDMTITALKNLVTARSDEALQVMMQSLLNINAIGTGGGFKFEGEGIKVLQSKVLAPLEAKRNFQKLITQEGELTSKIKIANNDLKPLKAEKANLLKKLYEKKDRTPVFKQRELMAAKAEARKLEAEQKQLESRIDNRDIKIDIKTRLLNKFDSEVNGLKEELKGLNKKLNQDIGNLGQDDKSIKALMAAVDKEAKIKEKRIKELGGYITDLKAGTNIPYSWQKDAELGDVGKDGIEKLQKEKYGFETEKQEIDEKIDILNNKIHELEGFEGILEDDIETTDVKNAKDEERNEDETWQKSNAESQKQKDAIEDLKTKQKDLLDENNINAGVRQNLLIQLENENPNIKDAINQQINELDKEIAVQNKIISETNQKLLGLFETAEKSNQALVDQKTKDLKGAETKLEKSKTKMGPEGVRLEEQVAELDKKMEPKQKALNKLEKEMKKIQTEITAKKLPLVKMLILSQYVNSGKSYEAFTEEVQESAKGGLDKSILAKPFLEKALTPEAGRRMDILSDQLKIASRLISDERKAPITKEELDQIDIKEDNPEKQKQAIIAKQQVFIAEMEKIAQNKSNYADSPMLDIDITKDPIKNLVLNGLERDEIKKIVAKTHVPLKINRSSSDVKNFIKKHPELKKSQDVIEADVLTKKIFDDIEAGNSLEVNFGKSIGIKVKVPESVMKAATGVGVGFEASYERSENDQILLNKTDDNKYELVMTKGIKHTGGVGITCEVIEASMKYGKGTVNGARMTFKTAEDAQRFLADVMKGEVSPETFDKVDTLSVAKGTEKKLEISVKLKPPGIDMNVATAIGTFIPSLKLSVELSASKEKKDMVYESRFGRTVSSSTTKTFNASIGMGLEIELGDNNLLKSIVEKSKITERLGDKVGSLMTSNQTGQKVVAGLAQTAMDDTIDAVKGIISDKIEGKIDNPLDPLTDKIEKKIDEKAEELKLQRLKMDAKTLMGRFGSGGGNDLFKSVTNTQTEYDADGKMKTASIETGINITITKIWGSMLEQALKDIPDVIAREKKKDALAEFILANSEAGDMLVVKRELKPEANKEIAALQQKSLDLIEKLKSKTLPDKESKQLIAEKKKIEESMTTKLSDTNNYRPVSISLQTEISETEKKWYNTTFFSKTASASMTKTKAAFDL